jgi:ubiquinone/menaquinone biosynthesis C-methylase UbiE
MNANARQSFIRPDELWRSLDLRAQQSVVHLGCGAGFYLIPAAKIVGKDGVAVGIDIRQDMLDEVMNRAAREDVQDIIKTIRVDLEEKSLVRKTLENAIADWVLVANILHQTKPQPILKEAARLIKEKGRVIVVEWDTVATPLGPPPQKRVAKQDILALLPPLQLTVEKEFKPSPYHYGLLLVRQQP